LVFEIFDLKVADKQTHKQNSTLTDNKGPLKLSAREPKSLNRQWKSPIWSAWQQPITECFQAQARHH